MQGILAPFLWIFSLVYINDIMVYSQSYKEHLMHFGPSIASCEGSLDHTLPKEVSFCLHFNPPSGRKGLLPRALTHAEKVKAIMELATPINVCTLQSFLGMAVYFSHYIPGYALLVAPLFELLKKKK